HCQPGRLAAVVGQGQGAAALDLLIGRPSKSKGDVVRVGEHRGGGRRRQVEPAGTLLARVEPGQPARGAGQRRPDPPGRPARVPLPRPYPPSGRVDSTSTPGATRSGFAVNAPLGPRELKSASRSVASSAVSSRVTGPSARCLWITVALAPGICSNTSRSSRPSS